MAEFAFDDDPIPSSQPAFSSRESFTDSADRRRAFDLIIHALPNHGFTAIASEVTNARHGGYVFRAFAEGSLVIALGRLRSAVRAGLAQRFLIEQDGALDMPLEKMCGRISAEGLVVDGQLINWKALRALLSQYEGWDFELRIPFEPDR